MGQVLIIDDDEHITRLLETHLTDEGHQVTVTHDGETGMSQAERMTPDLIMLDVFLPDATGYQMCNRLRKNPSTRTTPIIMMTGAARFPNQQMYGRQRGANESVERVVEPRHLVPTCPRDEQREIAREIIDGFTGAGSDEMELFRRIGDAAGPIDVERVRIGENRARQTIATAVHQN